jgi:transposase
VKSAEEIMKILEAYDLTGSLRDAAELAGLVDRSKGKIRADVAHEKITAMGYAGSERTTRRAVADLKVAWNAGRRRVHRPWIAEPGMWAQYDFGDGPAIGTTATILFCLWLAWSRFRVIVPLADKTWPSVAGAIDTALRTAGGVPTYLLTDNEKTVTVEHVAGIPVRNPSAVEFGRYYSLTVATCVPYDPASKGGSESTVKLAKADLVPTQASLLPAYRSFAELESACRVFCEHIRYHCQAQGRAARLRSAVERALPHAVIVVDHFHLVRLANQAVTKVRQRVTRQVLGRRGTTRDPARANRRRLLRARERLTPEQFTRMWEEIQQQEATGELLAAWIAKEELRYLLSLASTRAPRSETSNRLFAFYDWCARADVPEVTRLARTIEAW